MLGTFIALRVRRQVCTLVRGGQRTTLIIIPRGGLWRPQDVCLFIGRLFLGYFVSPDRLSLSGLILDFLPRAGITGVSHHARLPCGG